MPRISIGWDKIFKTGLVETLKNWGLVIIGDPHNTPEPFTAGRLLVEEVAGDNEGKVLLMELGARWNKDNKTFLSKYNEFLKSGEDCNLDKDSSIACIEAAIGNDWMVRGCEDMPKLKEAFYKASNTRQTNIANEAKEFLNFSTGGIMIYGGGHVKGGYVWRAMAEILTGNKKVEKEALIKDYEVDMGKFGKGTKIVVQCVPYQFFNCVENRNRKNNPRKNPFDKVKKTPN